MYAPELEIDNEILNLVSDVAVLADRASDGMIPLDPRLRRTDHIRSIWASLAIEGSSLSLDDVRDIINGKSFDGDPQEIREVKNTNRTYSIMDTFDPCSIDDLQKAHGEMMKGLIEQTGGFRDCDIGVYEDDVPVHIAPDPDEVKGLMTELMEWSSDHDMNPLVKACIFHYRFEYIHPFIDGNGRMGRLWQTLILSKWNPVFAYLPVESYILENRQDYYGTLTEADDGNVAAFVKNMLHMIRNALIDLNNEMRFTSGTTKRESDILNMISKNPKVTVSNIASSLHIADRTVKRYLSALTAKGWIRRVGNGKTGHWEIL